MNFFFWPLLTEPRPQYSVLTDESAGKSGDLYIRSVCFSPDGKYLATGAEDKQIRVSFFLFFFLLFDLIWSWFRFGFLVWIFGFGSFE